jgi:drug/metabolite transporter (DMT)-like permease
MTLNTTGGLQPHGRYRHASHWMPGRSPSCFSYLVWFWLLRHYLTSRLILLTLMTPVCGVLFGVALLNDPIDLRFALGSLLVLAGVLIVNIRLKTRDLQSIG